MEAALGPKGSWLTPWQPSDSAAVLCREDGPVHQKIDDELVPPLTINTPHPRRKKANDDVKALEQYAPKHPMFISTGMNGMNGDEEDKDNEINTTPP